MSLEISYAKLVAFKHNLPGSAGDLVHESYAKRYNEIIEELAQSLRMDLEEFKVSLESLRYVGGIDPELGAMGSPTMIERPKIMMQLDALLTLFSFKEQKVEIGFKLE